MSYTYGRELSPGRWFCESSNVFKGVARGRFSIYIKCRNHLVLQTVIVCKKNLENSLSGNIFVYNVSITVNKIFGFKTGALLCGHPVY